MRRRTVHPAPECGLCWRRKSLGSPPLAPLFEYYDLGEFNDSYTLSFERRMQKLDPCLSEIALEQLGVAATAGITRLILPPVPNCAKRGLDRVLHLAQCA